jgi:hypothetical protein
MSNDELVNRIAERINSSLQASVSRGFTTAFPIPHGAAVTVQGLQVFAREFSRAIATAVGEVIAEAASH